MIEKLSSKLPRMVFRITQVNTLSTRLEFPELRERKLDIVMVRLVKPMGEFEFEEDLNVEQLFDDELLVVGGRESQWARRRVIELAELADVPWILPPDSWNSLILQEAFTAIGCKMPHIAVESLSRPSLSITCNRTLRIGAPWLDAEHQHEAISVEDSADRPSKPSMAGRTGDLEKIGHCLLR